MQVLVIEATKTASKPLFEVCPCRGVHRHKCENSIKGFLHLTSIEAALCVLAVAEGLDVVTAQLAQELGGEGAREKRFVDPVVRYEIERLIGRNVLADRVSAEELRYVLDVQPLFLDNVHVELNVTARDKLDGVSIFFDEVTFQLGPIDPPAAGGLRERLLAVIGCDCKYVSI